MPRATGQRCHVVAGMPTVFSGSPLEVSRMPLGVHREFRPSLCTGTARTHPGASWVRVGDALARPVYSPASLRMSDTLHFNALANDASFGMRQTGFGFTVTNAGSPTVVVEACTNLTNPVWVPVGTNTLTGGSSDFNDSQWTNYPCRFYRFQMP